MSDHKKCIGKKRQKIFSIEKIYPKKTPKNLVFSEIVGIFASNLPISIAYDENYNSFYTTDAHRNGLQTVCPGL